MQITIPELSLVVLVGASGSGKSTFARKHFKPTEILSSDFYRGIVADDENDQSATQDAFDVLHYVLRKRLTAGRLTVVDATNVRSEDGEVLLKNDPGASCAGVVRSVVTGRYGCRLRQSDSSAVMCANKSAAS